MHTFDRVFFSVVTLAGAAHVIVSLAFLASL